MSCRGFHQNAGWDNVTKNNKLLQLIWCVKQKARYNETIKLRRKMPQTWFISRNDDARAEQWTETSVSVMKRWGVLEEEESVFGVRLCVWEVGKRETHQREDSAAKQLVIVSVNMSQRTVRLHCLRVWIIKQTSNELLLIQTRTHNESRRR